MGQRQRERAEGRICPILPQGDNTWQPCLENSCAWWGGDQCSVRDIGRWAEWQMIEVEREELRSMRGAE